MRSVVRPSPGWTLSSHNQSLVELQVPPMRALDTHCSDARGRQVIAPLAGGVGTRGIKLSVVLPWLCLENQT